MEEKLDSIVQDFIEKVFPAIEGRDPDEIMEHLASSFLRLEGGLTKKFIEAVARQMPDNERRQLIGESSPDNTPPEDMWKTLAGKPKYPGPSEDALEWLQNVWGDHLKFFGAKENSLYQDQLNKLDPELMGTLRSNSKYRHKIETSGLKLSEIIPTKKERLTKEIEELDRGAYKKVRKLGWVIQRRMSRSGVITNG